MKRLIELLCVVLIITMCIGNFDYLYTKKFISDKLKDVNNAIDNVSGLVGQNDSFRVTSNSPALLSETVYAFGENMTIKTALGYSTDYYYQDYEYGLRSVVYEPDFIPDAVNYYIYELKVYGENGKIVFLPCVRCSKGATEYFIVDPLNYMSVWLELPIGIGKNARAEIVFENAKTNLLQINGDLVTPMSLDGAWRLKYEGSLSLMSKIKEFLRKIIPDMNDYKYINTEPLEASFTNSLVSITDYFNGKYIYKNPIDYN